MARLPIADYRLPKLMSRDNVTPFRPRPRKPPPHRPQGQGLGLKTHRGKAVLVQLAALAAFALSFAFPTFPLSLLGLAVGVAGVFIAVSNRMEAMPWAATHHEHAMRTIVIGAAIWTLAGLLPLFGADILVTITFFVWLGVLIWVAVRAGVGLVLAILRKPINNPRGWLF